MEFSSICRTCLATKHLNPIFEEEDANDSVSTMIFITTGLKVKQNDGFPQKMCKICQKFLKEVHKFRKMCKIAEIQLMNMKNESYEISLPITKTQKSNKRKKSKEIPNNSNSLNIKIENGFDNDDDDIPLLQQKFTFTQFSDKNVDTKSEVVQENNQLHLYKTYDEKNEEQLYYNKLNIEQEIVVNNYSDDKQEINDSNNSKEIKIDSEFINVNSFEAELKNDMSDDSKYETEFLDLSLDSDCDNIPNDIKLENYDLEICNDIEIPKNNNMLNETETYQEIQNNDNLKKKLKQPNKDTKTTVKNLEIDAITDLKNIVFMTESDMKNEIFTENDVKNIVIENMPFLVKNDNRVTCKLCQKDLSRRSIDAHMTKSHPGADSRKDKCDLCDNYVLKSRLKRHKMLMHGVDGFRCGYCKTEFDTKEMLLEHVSSCSAKTKKRKAVADKRKELIVECDICNKSMQKASLRLHKEIKHAGLGPVCEHCGRRFGNKFRLSEHLRAKHGYEKFKCSYCDFLSASTMAMQNHERRHRGERPFACGQCGAKFHAAYLLAQHKQSHRTRRDIKCEQCPAAFKARNTLHMHRITCHNTKTYQCPMCPRTYSARHYAVKHMRSVHRHTGPVGDLLVGPKEPHDKDEGPM